MSEERIRVIQLITGLGNGGAERLVLDLIEGLDEKRFDVRLVSLSSELSALDTYGHQSRKVDVFDMSGRGRWQSILRLWRFVREFRPDIIHAHMFHALMASCLAQLVQHKRPSICFTSHTAAEGLKGGRASLIKFTRSRRKADIVFQKEQHPHLNCRNTVVIPNGVIVPNHLRIRKNWINSDVVRLIFVGRLIDVKDPLGLIRAIYDTKNKRLHLDLFGEGPLQGECEKLIADLGLGGRVKLRGLVSDVRKEINSSDIFVMHSRHEGMPMALLEAGSESIPVISTPVGSIPKLLEQGRGLVSTPEEFPRHLNTMASNPEDYIDMGANLYKFIKKNHSITMNSRRHSSLYSSICGKK